MSSNRLAAVIEYFQEKSHLGAMAITEADFTYFRKIVSEFVKHNAYSIEEDKSENPNITAQNNKRVIMANDCLWLVFSQIQNINQRFYKENYLAELNIIERKIPYALAMAIFQYLAREVGKSEESAFHNMEQHAFFEIFRMMWRNEEWNAVEDMIVGQLRGEGSTEKELREALVNIASRYQDNIESKEKEIHIESEEALQQAIADLKAITDYLTKAKKLDKDDDKTLNALHQNYVEITNYLTEAKKLDEDFKKLEKLNKAMSDEAVNDLHHKIENLQALAENKLVRLLQYLMSIRYNFDNERREAGITAPGMMVPAALLVEAMKDIVSTIGNISLPSFTPTAAEWRDYALRTSFGNSYGQLLIQFPDAKFFLEVDKNKANNAEDQPDVEPSEVPYCNRVKVVHVSEVGALTGIKYDDQRLYEGPTMKDVLERVWAVIDKVDEGKEKEELVENLSGVLQKIGNAEEGEIDPFETMVNILRVINNKRPNVYLLEDVKDMEGLVGSIVDPYIATVIKNSGKLHHNPQEVELKSEYSEVVLIDMRARIDKELEQRFGFVWALYPNKETLLNDLISVKSIISALNKYRVASKKADSTQLEDYVAPFITKYCVNEVEKSYLNEYQQDAPLVNDDDIVPFENRNKPLDFSNPEQALAEIRKKVDAALAADLDLIWTWHPERQAILDKLINKTSLISAYQVAVEERPAPVAIDKELAECADNLIQEEIQAVKAEKHADKAAEDQALAARLGALKQKAQHLLVAKYKLVWTLRDDQATVLDKLFSPEAFDAAVKKIQQPIESFIESLHPSILKYIADRLQKEESKLDIANFLEDKLLPDLIAFHVPVVQAAVAQRKLVIQEGAEVFLKDVITHDFVYGIQVAANNKANLALGDTEESMAQCLKPIFLAAMQAEIKAKSISDRLQEMKEVKDANVDLMHPEHEKAKQIKIEIAQCGFIAVVKKLGVAYLWNESALKAGANIKLDELLAEAQNEVNKQTNADYDIAKVGSLSDYCKKIALPMLEAKIENCFESKGDDIAVNHDALNAIVSAPLSNLVATNEIDQRMLQHFGLFWLGEDKDNVLNQVIDEAEMAATKERVLVKLLQPKVQAQLNELVYTQLYHNVSVLDDKEPDENVQFCERVHEKASELVNASLAQSIGKLWSDHPQRETMLNTLVTLDAIRVAQDQILTRTKKIDAIFQEEMPTTAAVLIDWTNHLCKRLDNEVFYLEHHHNRLLKRLKGRQPLLGEAKQLEKTPQIIEEYKSFVAMMKALLVKMRLANGQSFELLQACYLSCISMYKRFTLYADKGFAGSVFITHQIRTALNKAFVEMNKEIEAEHYGPASQAPALEKFIKITDLYNAIQEAKPDFEILTNYLGEVEEECDEDNVVKRLKQAMTIFKNYQPDYTGWAANLFQKAIHPFRGHDADARAIVTEFSARLEAYVANKKETIDVLSKARNALMDRMVQLIQAGKLKEDFLKSSLGRRLIFSINFLLSEDRQPLKLDFKQININIKSINTTDTIENGAVPAFVDTVKATAMLSQIKEELNESVNGLVLSSSLTHDLIKPLPTVLVQLAADDNQMQVPAGLSLTSQINGTYPKKLFDKVQLSANGHNTNLVLTEDAEHSNGNHTIDGVTKNGNENGNENNSVNTFLNL